MSLAKHCSAPERSDRYTKVATAPGGFCLNSVGSCLDLLSKSATESRTAGVHPGDDKRAVDLSASQIDTAAEYFKLATQLVFKATAISHIARPFLLYHYQKSLGDLDLYSVAATAVGMFNTVSN
jgi:hypothetical protein